MHEINHILAVNTSLYEYFKKLPGQVLYEKKNATHGPSSGYFFYFKGEKTLL